MYIKWYASDKIRIYSVADFSSAYQFMYTSYLFCMSLTRVIFWNNVYFWVNVYMPWSIKIVNLLAVHYCEWTNFFCEAIPVRFFSISSWFPITLVIATKTGLQHHNWPEKVLCNNFISSQTTESASYNMVLLLFIYLTSQILYCSCLLE